MGVRARVRARARARVRWRRAASPKSTLGSSASMLGTMHSPRMGSARSSGPTASTSTWLGLG